MSELVEPSPGKAESHALSGAIRYAFGEGFVVEAGEDLYASDTGADGPLDGFEESHDENSHTVEISSGEAFVAGKYLWIDEPTEVEVEPGTFTTIEVGWPADSGNDVRIDHEDGDDYPSTGETIPLWTFSADQDGVTTVTDERNLGENYVFDGDLEVQGSEIRMPEATGTNGLEFGSGNHYSMYQDWATVYALEDDGSEGFRVRNPDGPGDLLRVDLNGELWSAHHFNVGSDIYSRGDGVPRVTSEWDGNSMTLETPSGTEIEFISED